MTDVICTVQDAQELGFCVRGQRKLWRTHSPDMTFEQFIRDGASAEWLMATGNPYAVKLATYVLSKQNG